MGLDQNDYREYSVQHASDDETKYSPIRPSGATQIPQHASDPETKHSPLRPPGATQIQSHIEAPPTCEAKSLPTGNPKNQQTADETQAQFRSQPVSLYETSDHSDEASSETSIEYEIKKLFLEEPLEQKFDADVKGSSVNTSNNLHTDNGSDCKVTFAPVVESPTENDTNMEQSPENASNDSHGDNASDWQVIFVSAAESPTENDTNMGQLSPSDPSNAYLNVNLGEVLFECRLKIRKTSPLLTNATETLTNTHLRESPTSTVTLESPKTEENVSDSPNMESKPSARSENMAPIISNRCTPETKQHQTSPIEQIPRCSEDTVNASSKNSTLTLRNTQPKASVKTSSKYNYGTISSLYKRGTSRTSASHPHPVLQNIINFILSTIIASLTFVLVFILTTFAVIRKTAEISASCFSRILSWGNRTPSHLPVSELVDIIRTLAKDHNAVTLVAVGPESSKYLIDSLPVEKRNHASESANPCSRANLRNNPSEQGISETSSTSSSSRETLQDALGPMSTTAIKLSPTSPPIVVISSTTKQGETLHQEFPSTSSQVPSLSYDQTDNLQRPLRGGTNETDTTSESPVTYFQTCPLSYDETDSLQRPLGGGTTETDITDIPSPVRGPTKTDREQLNRPSAMTETDTMNEIVVRSERLLEVALAKYLTLTL